MRTTVSMTGLSARQWAWLEGFTPEPIPANAIRMCAIFTCGLASRDQTRHIEISAAEFMIVLGHLVREDRDAERLAEALLTPDVLPEGLGIRRMSPAPINDLYE